MTDQILIVDDVEMAASGPTQIVSNPALLGYDHVNEWIVKWPKVDEVLDKARQYAANCTDTENVDPRQILYGDGDLITFKDGSEALQLFGNIKGFNPDTTAVLSKRARGQLGDRLGGPWLKTGFLKELQPTERKMIANHRLPKHSGNGDWLVRQKGPEVRAVLSSQYTPFDNLKLLDLTEEALRVETGQHTPHAFRGTNDFGASHLLVEDNLRAQLILPGRAGLDPDGKGGGLHIMVTLKDSEVGEGGVWIVPGVFRYICANGLIWGLKQKESREFFHAHRFISMTAMEAWVRKTIAKAMKLSAANVEKFVAAADIKLTNIPDLLKQLTGRTNITQTEKENWAIRVQGNSLFDVLNGLTATARDTVDPIRVVELETLAGQFLNMARSELVSQYVVTGPQQWAVV